MAEPGPRQVFLSSIVRISFPSGEKWIRIFCAGSTEEDPPMLADFYDEDGEPIDGANPGYEVPTAFHAPPPAYPDAFEEPHTITSEDLEIVEPTLDAIPGPAKEFNAFRTWLNLFAAGGSNIFINAKGLPNIFRVKLTFGGTTGTGAYEASVTIYSNGEIVPGVIIPDGPVPADSETATLGNSGDPGVVLDQMFEVNKTEETVTLL
jgi:hypothetical protein